MDEPSGQGSDAGPYLKLPWPLVAGALAALLLVVLGAGLYANRYLRPQTSVQPLQTIGCRKRKPCSLDAEL